MTRLAYVAWIWVMGVLGVAGFGLGSVAIVLRSPVLGDLAGFWLGTSAVGALAFGMTYGLFEAERPPPLPNRDARRQMRQARAVQARERETRRLEIEAGLGGGEE